MNKIKAFLYVFKKSFDPKYYNDVLKASFSFSLKYYFFYFLIFGLVSSIYMNLKYFIPFSKSLENLPQKIVNSYPENLVLEVKDGNLSSNYEQPLIISFDMVKEFTKDLDKRFNNFSNDNFVNFLVIDTNAQIDDFKNYKTMVLVTRNNVVSYGENNNYQVSPLGNSNNFILDKNFINGNIESLVLAIKYLPWVLGFGFFWFMIGILPLLMMVYLVFYSLIMMFISSLNNKKLDFKKSFQIGMHLETLWMTIFGLIIFMEWRFRVPFVQTLFMVGYSVMILREIKVKT